MAISPQEASASLRVLVAMAQADGVLHAKERALLESSLEGVALPDGASLADLLERRPDLDAALAELTSLDARRQTYVSAYALAHADGERHESEKQLLGRLREALEIPDHVDDTLGRLFAMPATAPGPKVQAVPPERREETVRAETRKCAIVSAVLGAFPFPGFSVATDLAIVALQVGLARDIAKIYGHELDRKSARRLLAAFEVGTGVRIAVTNLVKLFPGWGSAAGAASGYATSWAVGRVVARHFEGGARLDPEALRSAFASAKVEGGAAFERDRAEVEAARSERAEKLSELDRKLKAGELSGEELERRAAEL